MTRPKNMNEYPDGTVMAHPYGGVYRRDADGWKVRVDGEWLRSVVNDSSLAVPPLGLVMPPPEPKPLTVGELEQWSWFEHCGELWQASGTFVNKPGYRWCLRSGVGSMGDNLPVSTIPTKVYGILGRDCEITMIEKGGA